MIIFFSCVLSIIVALEDCSSLLSAHFLLDFAQPEVSIFLLFHLCLSSVISTIPLASLVILCSFLHSCHFSVTQSSLYLPQTWQEILIPLHNCSLTQHEHKSTLLTRKY